MPKSLPSAKEASWRQIVDEYASSGRSAKEFCQLKAISLRMFYFWRRKITLKDQGLVPLNSQRKDDHRELAIVPLGPHLRIQRLLAIKLRFVHLLDQSHPGNKHNIEGLSLKTPRDRSQGAR